tara:strand:- start:277 stop:1458 length:1182 start_codon:yes stop_codon:yes gene_type:complete
MSKISLKHSGGNVVSLNAPTNAPGAADVAFKLPNTDGSDGQALVTDGSGNLSFSAVGGGAGKAKNLIINGAMQVCQRGTSTTSPGFFVDRYKLLTNGCDDAPEQRQANLGTGDTGPYEEGFRRSYKITNGNQTSGAGAADYIFFRQQLEAQDIANSGWHYTNTSSFITLSFWVKSSVAQNFYGYLRSEDGTSYIYPFETGSLTADTWTKVTKTIPGNSNLQFDNNNGIGLSVNFAPFWGTDYTDSGASLNAWGAYGSGATRAPDYTSTWFTTNDATFEITGLQLEVGNSATSFEHKTFGEVLALCQRYYFIHAVSIHNSGGNYEINFIPVNMRATPTATRLSGVMFGGESSTSFSSIQTLTTGQSAEVVTLVYVLVNSSDANCGGKYAFTAEI